MNGNGNRELKRISIREIGLQWLHPAHENEAVYRPVRDDDPDIIAIAESMRKDGVLQPINVTSDFVIISGHRRWTAAKLAGLFVVPCIVENFTHEDPRFLALLTEHNRQRVKSLDEHIREAVVQSASADNGDAYESLIDHRKERAEVYVDEMDLGETKDRAEISPAKHPFLNAILRILRELKPYWPLSQRQIHYNLLNDPPLVHASKPNSHYGNEKRFSQNLSNLCTRAYFEGYIPEGAIDDSTRPIVIWNAFRDAGTFLRDQIDNMFAGYWRDLLQSQPNHIEILAEKNTLKGIIDKVAMKYTMVATYGRGYCSRPPRTKMAERFKASGKEKLVLLMLSDFDPSGEDIARSYARSMRDDFGIDEIVPVKVALTFGQVARFNLIPRMQAKEDDDPRGKKFVEKHGKDVFELEALRPAVLAKLLEEAIDSVLDVDAFNHELDREKADAAEIKTKLKIVRKAMA